MEGGRAGPLLFVAAGQGATFAEFEMRSDGSEARVVDPYGVTDAYGRIRKNSMGMNFVANCLYS